MITTDSPSGVPAGTHFSTGPFSAAAPVPAGVAEIISLLVDRAKLDRKGVFWAVGVKYRQANFPQFESSLGFGTAGIVLTLLEYYRRAQDQEVAELIAKGCGWLTHRVAAAPALAPGYYAGTAGLWHLFAEVERTLPGLLPEWTGPARAALAARPASDGPAAFASGLAGTLVGAMENLTAAGMDWPELESATAELLGVTKPCAAGVFWDFTPMSIRPAAGFLQGNAGVDFCFAQLRRRYGVAYPSLLAGSLAYADSLFDETVGNWLDQDAAARTQLLGAAEIEKLMTREAALRLADTIHAEDGLSWGMGTAGLLVARSAVAATYGPDAVGRAAARDCTRAIQRLGRATEVELGRLDGTLLLGLPGVALAVASCREILPAAEFAPLAALLGRATARLAEIKPAVENEDLSLLGGVAGLAYARLKLSGDAAARNCLRPGFADAIESAPAARAGDLAPLFARRLTPAGALPEVRAAVANSPVSLTTISAAVEPQRRRDAGSALTKSIEHELGLYHALADVRFHALFWQELVKRGHYARHYAEGMTENLLFERFQLDPAVTLLELDFDPYARADQPANQPLHLLRSVTSSGVAEVRLSALQQGLIAGFRTPGVALEVIHRVIRRVETPNVTQRQLADLSLKMIRGFLQAGYLTADRPGKMEAWLLRRRLKEMRRNLFPATDQSVR